MNYFYLRLFAVSAAAAVALSCQEQNGPADAVALATPEVSAAVSGDNVTVSWTQIPNAATYSWNIDSNAARTTDQTSVTVSTSDLAEGEHTVYVIANPALDAADQYTASQPGSYTFTVARVEPQRLETPIVTAKSDGKGGVVVSWSSIEHAASYTYSLDSGEWKSTTDTTVTYQTSDLTATTHTVSVIAQPEEGSAEYRESLPGDCSFPVQHELVEPVGELKSWLGTYTLKFTSAVVVDLNSNNQAEFVFKKGMAGKLEEEITIQPSTNANYVWISGLSPLSEYYLWATMLDSEDGKRCLGIVTGDKAVAQDRKGNDMVCAPICWNEEDDVVTIFSGTEYAFLIDPDTKTSISRELMSSSNVQYTVVAADIFSFDNGVGVYYGDYPTYIPAGTFTFTKTSPNYAAQDSKVMTVVKAAPTSMSSTVTK